MPGLQRSVATGVAQALSKELLVEGVFLAGSLVGESADPLSDVDLGIVTVDGADQASLAEVLWRRVVDQLGKPVHRLERGWSRCRMMALLFGRRRFPPLGLEVDLVWSEIADAGEQMPYGPYEVLVDRLDRLSPALDALPGQPAVADVVQELAGTSTGSLFSSTMR